jgi:hypothetical protein
MQNERSNKVPADRLILADVQLQLFMQWRTYFEQCPREDNVGSPREALALLHNMLLDDFLAVHKSGKTRDSGENQYGMFAIGEMPFYLIFIMTRVKSQFHIDCTCDDATNGFTL